MARIIPTLNSKKKADYYGEFVNLYKGGYSMTKKAKKLPVDKTVAQPDKELEEDDYQNMSKEELIALISTLKKEMNENEIKIKAYQTLIEIVGRNIGKDMLKTQIGHRN